MFAESDPSGHQTHEPDAASAGEQFAAGAADGTADDHHVHDLALHEVPHDEPDADDPSIGEHPADPAHGTGGTDAGSDLVAASADGTQIDLGPPNLSYSGHGLDSVGVEDADGSLEVYTDADHDGEVDQAVRIDADGTFTNWTTDGHGHWTVHATGHVDATGHAVVDHAIDPATAHSAPSIAGGAASAPPADHTAAGGRTYPGVAAGDLAVAADGHYIDAGPATYDLDGDGRADTAVVQSDGRIIQVSDTNGDGRADEMLQVDSATHQAAILTDDGSGHWQVAATGHISATGQFVQERSAGVTGPAEAEPPDPAPDPAPVPAAAPVPAPAAPAADPTTDPTTHTPGAAHAPDIVYTSPNGARTDLGAPDRDLNGDGVPESVAVRTDDGDVLVLSDTNADGRPDQLLQVDAATGDATWAVPDGHGGWEVVQTGHVEADGTVVVDHAQPAHGTQSAPAQHAHEEAAGTAGHPDDDVHPDDNVEVEVSGQSFDAGPATIDTDGDGVPDTVAVTGAGGSTLFYQDTNGDGVADKAWTTDSGGRVTADYALESGRWVAVTAPGPSS